MTDAGSRGATADAAPDAASAAIGWHRHAARSGDHAMRPTHATTGRDAVFGAVKLHTCASGEIPLASSRQTVGSSPRG